MTTVNVTPDKRGEIRKHSEVSTSSTPSPLPKSFKMDSTDSTDPNTNMKNEILDVQNSDDAAKVFAKFEPLPLNDKVNNMFSLLLDMKIAVSSITQTHSMQQETVTEIKDDVENLKSQLRNAHGRINRLDQTVHQLHKEVEECQWRQMKINLVFYNMNELPNENCEHVLINMMRDIMKIQPKDIYTPNNLAGEIRIADAHRIPSTGGRVRPLVAKFLTPKGRNMVLSHVKNLKGNTISISEQFPPAMRERRAAVVRQMVAMKQDGNKSKLKVRKDKLFIDNKEAASIFEDNPLHHDLHDQDLQCKKYEDMSHTEIREVDGSRFQGHAAVVQSPKEAAQARDALFQSTHVSKASSIIYAYKVRDVESGQVVRGFSDDREWCGAVVLKDIIEKTKQENIFLAVSRHHKGPNLGAARFTHIGIVAKQAFANELNLPNDWEDTMLKS